MFVSEPTVQQIYVACGAGGAYTDVTSYLSTVGRSWGRTSEFSDFGPGTFSFVLANADGRFTPGNATTLPTPLSEGMGVCWQLEGRLVAGRIRTLVPYFDSDNADNAWVQVVCDDALGSLARRDLAPLNTQLANGQDPYLYIPFGRSALVDVTGNFNYLGLNTVLGVNTITMTEVDGPGDGDRQSRFDAGARGDRISQAGGLIVRNTIAYDAGSMGCWGVWVTPLVTSGYMSIQTSYLGLNDVFGLSLESGQFVARAGTAVIISPLVLVAGEPHYLELTITYTSSTVILVDFYIDSAHQGRMQYAQASGTVVAGGQLFFPSSSDWLRITLGDSSGSPTQVCLARLAHTARPVREATVGWSMSERTALLGMTRQVPEVTLDTLPAGLSLYPVGQVAGGSVLDAVNAVIRTEQGHLYAVTSGTVSAPVEKLVVRSADRPTTVSATFDIAGDILGAPDFVRDITNMVSAVTVSGPDSELIVTDSTLTDRVGSASAREQIVSTSGPRMQAWGEDRLQRGANIAVRVASFRVNANTTSTDMWSTLLGLKAGDRIRVTGLPVVQLGFSTWDGWLLGISESHDYGQHIFALYLAPVLPPTAVFDTDRFMSGGELYLPAGINASVTSMQVATTGSTLAVSGFPYNLSIDSEVVQVTACSGATPQVLTVVRGQLGTTAVSHLAGASVEVAGDTVPTPAGLFAF